MENIFIKRTVFAILIAVTFSIADAKCSGGSGASNDPYLISTAGDMNQIGCNNTDWDKHFKLTADINLCAYTGNSSTASALIPNMLSAVSLTATGTRLRVSRTRQKTATLSAFSVMPMPRAYLFCGQPTAIEGRQPKPPLSNRPTYKFYSIIF